jgi:hypothetical protein
MLFIVAAVSSGDHSSTVYLLEVGTLKVAEWRMKITMYDAIAR